MQPYHYAWLTAHPHRAAEWLQAKLREGFDIHHLDGDHSNNDPLNLVLIDGADHMMLHNGSKRLSRVLPRRRKPKPQPVVEVEISQDPPVPKKVRFGPGWTLHDEMRHLRALDPPIAACS